MRSPDEILFRLRQEFFNLGFFLLPPRLSSSSWRPTGVPDPQLIGQALNGTPFAAEVVNEAEMVLGGKLSLLGFEFETGPRPAWRRDYVSGIESDNSYFRRIPYLDAATVGDHKNIWELNRHQQLALLSMAALLTGRQDFASACAGQLESWLDENPFLRGINWTSALEVAFRALSWIWILSWIGDRLPESLRQRLTTSLYQHGLYLEYNLSVYFSPNTHLLGEAVVLHLLGRFFPDWPRASKWERNAAEIVEAQVDFQMQADGVHFEQSTYYHVYAVDFFLLHRIFARRVPAAYDEKLRQALDYLRTLLGPRWKIPFIGDDDGGRLFHPFGDRATFGRATMATAAVLFNESGWLRDPSDLHVQAFWWLGPRTSPPALGRPVESRLFLPSGMTIFAAADVHVTFDAGSFGWAGAGHSHSDTLSLTATAGEEEILIDPATYTYVGNAQERDRFRGSASHNTIRLDGKDQAEPAGPFRWNQKPDVQIESYVENSIVATCRYHGLTHRRRVTFDASALTLTVVDEIEGEGEHTIEQLWHAGEPVRQLDPQVWRIGNRTNLRLSPDLAVLLAAGWRSHVLGRKSPCQVLIGSFSGPLPVRFVSEIAF